RVEGFEQAVCLAEAFRAQHFEGVYGRLSAQKAIAQTGIEDVLKQEMRSKDWGRRYQRMSASTTCDRRRFSMP
ncbi:MAG: hypothetical protein ACYDDT_11670, partial [Sulfuricella sp.]